MSVCGHAGYGGWGWVCSLGDGRIAADVSTKLTGGALEGTEGTVMVGHPEGET